MADAYFVRTNQQNGRKFNADHSLSLQARIFDVRSASQPFPLISKRNSVVERTERRKDQTKPVVGSAEAF